MARSLAINGRFLAQPISGVQRYARELIQALDSMLAGSERGALSSATILVPPAVPAEALPRGLLFVKCKTAGRLGGHLWEQLELPRATGGAFLLNLTNSAPLMHTRQLVAIHDAAIMEYPADFKWAYRCWYRGLYMGLSRTPARFISVSAFAARDVSRHFRIQSDRIAVVPNAAEHFSDLKPDMAALANLNLCGRTYILAIGGFSKRKNLELIEKALARIANPPLLIVVGGSASRAFASPANRIAGSVVFDHVTDATIKALYSRALCLAFPSRYEGFGLPPLEAMSCGCPVITSHAASMREVCGDAALYCDPDRPQTLADSIQLLLSSPTLRQDLILRGFRRARDFSWKASAHKLLDIISQQP